MEGGGAHGVGDEFILEQSGAAESALPISSDNEATLVSTVCF